MFGLNTPEDRRVLWPSKCFEVSGCSLRLIPGVPTRADRSIPAWPFRVDCLDYWTDLVLVNNKACCELCVC